MMKQILACATAFSLLLSLSACSSVVSPARDSLSLMKAVNDSNIVNPDPACRLWYQIETSAFADSDGDGSGDLQGVINHLDYISDGDPQTSESDLNMTGLFLNELIQTGSLSAIQDYYTINPDYGDVAVLARLCENAARRDMDVMMTLDLSTYSTESAIFTGLIEAASSLKEDDTLKDLDYEYAGMFYLSDKDGKNMYPLGDTRFYYEGFAESSSPRINQDNPAWRQLITNVVTYYMNLGINGFYIPDCQSIFPDDQQKNQEFLAWFNKMVKDRNPYAVITASSTSYTNNLNDLGIYVAQNSFAGADGYISKAVTGAMDALQLADQLQKQNTTASYFLTGEGTNMDLLKSESREDELKMALGLLVLMSGQVFICAGDEIGLPGSEVQFTAQALDDPESKNSVFSPDFDSSSEENQTGQENTQLSLTFGSVSEQLGNGNSVLNFLLQAIRLRDSYTAIAAGETTILSDLSTESLLVVKKDTDESSVVLVFNLSDSVSSMETSKILIHDLPAELGGILICHDDPITLDDNVLTLPAHSAAVLK